MHGSVGWFLYRLRFLSRSSQRGPGTSFCPADCGVQMRKEIPPPTEFHCSNCGSKQQEKGSWSIKK